MAAIKPRLIVAAAAAFASAAALGQDFGSLLRAGTELLAEVQAEADRTALAARELGRAMSVPDREALQAACTAVVAAPDDVAAERRLQRLLARYRDSDPEALMRLCLDPAYRRLQSDIRTTTMGLERAQTIGGALRSEAELEERLEEQRRTFETIGAVSRQMPEAAGSGGGGRRR